MKSNTATLIVLVAMLVLVIPAVLGAGKMTETFSAGEYPCAVSQLPLADSYKTVADPGYTKNSVQDIFQNYPLFDAKHCGTNNIRYWRRPTNGLCTPPGMCGGLYETTEPVIPPQPSAPTWSQEPRVNFYVAAP